ncbi:MAG: UPF0182 family protein [Gemmatimonadota bacterium]|nr:UPF0182 family protein [Gemmatimonadota bacterium]
MTLPFDGPGRRVMPPMRRELRRLILIVAALVFVVMFVVPWLATFATDWLWFREVGFTAVYLTSLGWRVALFVVGAGLAYAIVGGNIRLAAGRPGKTPALFIHRPNQPPLDVTAVVPRMLRLGALLVAFVVAVSLSALWMTFVQALHAAPVGTADPLFGRDIGFYMFQLPAVSVGLGLVIALLVLSLAAVLLVYVLRGELPLVPRHAVANPGAERHVGALLAALFLLTAVRLWIVRSAELLYSTTGPLAGASYTDVHVMLPGIRLSAAVAVIGAGLVLYGAARGKLLRWGLIAVGAYAAVGVVARGIVPYAVQRLVVLPNELVKETPYLKDHIVATRAAWGISGVQTRPLSGEARLTMADIKANAPTINNVRLWERDLLQQTFKQLQEIRTYYDFVSVNDDRYTIDGDYRQVHLSARELNSSSLPTQTFINNRLTFTHGMGVTMAPVNQVTSEGLPVLFIQDLPPTSSEGFALKRPEIYYGQLTDSYVFVHTAQKEFDYPSGDSDVYTSYAGTGGVPVGSFWRRALYAWEFGSAKILFSSDITAGARIMYHRNIMDRATTALPFLQFDPEPYVVVTDSGGLEWVLDGYTTSGGYPYSEPVGDNNYMRNSVKVTINAYNGAITAYAMDPNDPVLRTYEAIFPGIFRPLADMPADIVRHLRYPGRLFRIQATLEATYHMDAPDAFYHREDQWQIPAPSNQGGEAVPFMRHIIMRLPGEQKEEFIYMTPFTPRGKDNLAAWMVARMDGAHYGQLMVYQFPKQSLVYGPRQIVNRINQDTDISRQITLWDQRGSQVIRGELLVIPIEESLVYVQPLFLRASGGSIPELKRVVVASGNRVVMGETLDQALNAMFGSGAAVPVSEAADTLDTGAVSPAAPPAAGAAAAPAGTVAQLLQQAQDHYDRALAAQRAGNWAEYGRQIDALGAVIRQLQSRQHQ